MNAFSGFFFIFVFVYSMFWGFFWGVCLEVMFESEFDGVCLFHWFDLVWFLFGSCSKAETELYAPLALYCFCSFLFFGGFFVCVLLTINWLFISKISLFVLDRMLTRHHQSPCLIRGHQR